MITYIGNQLGHFMETDFDGEGAILVDYVRVRLLWNIDMPLRFQRVFQFGEETVVLKFRYEKLRNFCTTCGMLTHDVSECSANAHPPNDDPENDDDDDDDDTDYHPTLPDGNQPAETFEPMRQQKLGEEKIGDTAGTSKKRKAETPIPTETAYYPVMCCDMRQGYTTEDEQQCFAKRKKRESEVMEIRNWYFKPTSTSAPLDNTRRHTPTTPQTNRDGTVGQKPPEQE